MIGRWSRRTKQVVAGVSITATFMLAVSGGYIYWIRQHWQEEKRVLLNKADLLEQVGNKQVNKEVKRVWVLTKEKLAGTRLSSRDLKQIELPKSVVPLHTLQPQDINGKTIKIDLASNVPLVDSMIYQEKVLGSDIRWIETSVIQLPLILEMNHIIDVRIRYPDGQDYVVLSHKKVHNIQNMTVWFQMSEQELLTMSSACVDAFLNGGQIYAVRYIEPHVQERAVVNYPVNESVLELIKKNPNLVKDSNAVLSVQARKRLEGELKQHHNSIMETPSATVAGTSENSINNSSMTTAGKEQLNSNRVPYSPFTGNSENPMRDAPFVGQPVLEEQEQQTDVTQKEDSQENQSQINESPMKSPTVPEMNQNQSSSSNDGKAMDSNDHNVSNGYGNNHSSSTLGSRE